MWASHNGGGVGARVPAVLGWNEGISAVAESPSWAAVAAGPRWVKGKGGVPAHSAGRVVVLRDLTQQATLYLEGLPGSWDLHASKQLGACT